MDRLSSYLLDISKLVFGASVVPLFITGSQFGAAQFLLGILVSGLSFGIGLVLLRNQEK